MRLDHNHEAWLKFADSYWTLDNGKSAVELGQKMLTKYVEDARNTAYGYNCHLDETIAKTGKFVKNADQENLVDTLHNLCDIGETDAVTRALKNVTLGAIQKNTGKKPAQTNGGGAKITAGQNRSPVKFSGAKVNRSPTKSFNDVVDAPTKAFNRVVSDHLNVNAGATSILKEAIARKADGRVVNPTNAASTLKTTPIATEKGKPVNKCDTEETWTTFAKKEAEEDTGQMKSDTVAGKTIDILAMRMPSYSDTRARLPFEFRGVNPSDMATRLTQGVVDVVNPNGSAHGPIEFNTDGTQPATYRDEGKMTRPQYRNGKPYNGGPQQFPHRVRKDNIEAGPNAS
jgi:hypothetical protein